MFIRIHSLAFLLIVPSLLVGCGKGNGADTSSPEAFLKWSMNRYQASKGFSANSSIKIEAPFMNVHQSATRQISYGAPNMYKISTGTGTGPSLTAASDGKQEIDYSSNAQLLGVAAAAPTTLPEAKSAVMTSPLMEATLLFQFFGGASNLPNLADGGKDSITWGQDGKAPSGEQTKTVKFTGPGKYGHVEATIGVDTGVVYLLKFDSEPMVTEMRKGRTAEEELEQLKTHLQTQVAGKQKDILEGLLKQGKEAFMLWTVETYQNPKFESSVSESAFKIELPKGVVMAPPPPDGKSPVAVGELVPDFTVKDLKGADVKLSSLKGHPVLLDFWATWCGPCKKGLPITAAFAEQGAKSGLKVLAISTEDVPTISRFLGTQPFKLPAFTDTKGAATIAYHVNGIPTSVIIDSQGRLVEYIVGLHSPEDMAASLKKAGVDLGG